MEPWRDQTEVRNEIEEALARRDAEGLRSIVNDIASATFKEEPGSFNQPYSGDFFRFLLGLFDQEAFMTLAGVGHFLLLFAYDWMLMTPEQREQLRPKLESAYTRFSDPFAVWMVAHLLGEYYADAGALSAVRRLKAVADDGKRELLPMALDSIIRYAADPAVAAAALNELELMKNDPSPQVRYEVDISFGRVASFSGERQPEKG
jgi:hypothetical protein